MYLRAENGQFARQWINSFARTRDPVDRIQGRYEISTYLLSHPNTDHCSHWPDGAGGRIKAAESICQSNVKVAVCKQMCSVQRRYITRNTGLQVTPL